MSYSKKENYDKKTTDAIKSKYTSIIKSIGEDVKREGLVKTPERASKAMQFLTQGYDQDAKKILRSAMFKEEYGENPQVEKEVYKHLKEQGFEFDISENYGEPLSEGTYKVKHDIHNLEGDIVINIDEEVDFKATTDTILGYDVFKYKDVYLTWDR